MNLQRALWILLAAGIAVVAVFTAARGMALATPSDVPLRPNWSYEGEEQGDELGHAVAAAGDVNHDGYGDVIVGAPKASDGTSREGVSYVFRGSAQGVNADPSWKVGGGQKGSDFGAAVGFAGDVNGDTHDDVIVGAPQYGQPETGRVYVFYGSYTGLDTTPDWSFDIGERDARFGVAVGAAGDVDHDGYDDIIVGAQGYSDGQTQEGAAFVFRGSPTGPITTTYWIFESNQANALLGAAVSTAGDVNDDGYDDVIVGAPQYDGSETDAGAAFVFFGSEAGLSASYDWMAEGDQAEAEFGAAVGLAGRVNGDVYSDVIVGAPLYDAAQSDAGAAFVFHGSGAGPAASPNWWATSSQEGARFGAAVGGGGDVNDDGFDDVIVGAYRFQHDHLLEGAAFVFLGSSGGVGSPASWRAEGEKAEATFGASVGIAGDVNKDDHADLIVGAPLFRVQEVIRGKAFVFHGSQDIQLWFGAYLPLVLSAPR